jgi:hypothetical protein
VPTTRADDPIVGSIARTDPDRVNDSLRSTGGMIAISPAISGRHMPC